MEPNRTIVLMILLSLALVSLNAHVRARGWLPPQETQKMTGVIVRFCDLIEHPARYDGKRIRLHAMLAENQTPRVDGGDSYLYGSACRESEFRVVVAWSSNRTYGSLEQVRSKPDEAGNTLADVIVDGVFRDAGERKFGHLDWAAAEFIVENVEVARPAKSPKSPRPNKRLQRTRLSAAVVEP
jgi:hypothetical protein